MNMNYFKGIIKCNCKRNYNRKNNNGTIEYICSRKKNFGDCDSRIIKEKMLLEVIENHCNIYKKDYLPEKTKLLIMEIIVNKDDEIIIRWKDGLVSIIGNDKIVF